MTRTRPLLEAGVAGIEHQGFEQIVALPINQLLLVDPGAGRRHNCALAHRISSRCGREGWGLHHRFGTEDSRGRGVSDAPAATDQPELTQLGGQVRMEIGAASTSVRRV